MSEKRKRSHSALLHVGETKYLVEFFDATCWQGGKAGLYRMRVNGKWLGSTGQEFTFVTLQQGIKTALGLLADNPCVADKPRATKPASAPYLPEKAEVRVHFGKEFEGVPLHTERTFILCPPHQEIDGNWYVWVWAGGKQRKLNCNDVKLMRAR